MLKIALRNWIFTIVSYCITLTNKTTHVTLFLQVLDWEHFIEDISWILCNSRNQSNGKEKLCGVFFSSVFLSFNTISCHNPWSIGYDRRLASKKSWVRIPLSQNAHHIQRLIHSVTCLTLNRRWSDVKK